MIPRHRRTVLSFPQCTNFDTVVYKCSEQATAAVNDNEPVFGAISDL